MPYNTRSGGPTASGTSISKSLGVLVLVALGVLVILRHVYGSISIEAGAR